VPEDPSARPAPADSGDSRPKGVPRADESSHSRSVWLLLASTPLVLLVTYDVAFVAHEYGHSFAAWILGIKSSPWPIIWGGNSIGNIVFLSDMDEAFWFLFMQVGNLYCYVPIRVASPSGDMHNWTWGAHQSWWWLYVIIGYLVLWAMVDFYRTVLPTSLDASRIAIPVGRAVVLVTATLIMFGYFAGPGLMKDDDITQFISRTSLLLIPVVLLASWRRVVRTAR
jgi:hypothetical protein